MNNGSTNRTHLIRLLLATAGMVLLALVVARFGSGDSQPISAGEAAVSLVALPAPATTSPATVAPSPAVATPQSRDEALKAQFLGVWTHAENGDQWIENRPDGTARMLLKLNFVASLLYGKQIQMDLSWDVKDGVLSHTIVNGTPMENVNKIIKDYGKSRIYTILETTPERMLLQSLTDKQKDLWTRTPAPKEWEEKAATPVQ